MSGVQSSSALAAWSRSLEPLTASHSAAPSCLWAMERHKLPIKADLRRLLEKEEGDTVTIHLTERLG